MILINLLPHREAARKRAKEHFFFRLGASGAIGAIAAGLVFLSYQANISSQEAANSILKAETARLDVQIKDIKSLKSEISALKARQKSVEDLQSDRNTPVLLLSDLKEHTPDGVYLLKMIQKDQELTLNGVAQSNERIAEFLRNLSTNTERFSRPALIEIVAGNVNVMGKKQPLRVSNFVIKVNLVRPSDIKQEAQDRNKATRRKNANRENNIT